MYAYFLLSSVLHLFPEIESFDFGVKWVKSSEGISMLSGNKHLLKSSDISDYLSAISIILSLTPSFSTSFDAVLSRPIKVWSFLVLPFNSVDSWVLILSIVEDRSS